MEHIIRGQVTTAGMARLEQALINDEMGANFMLNADPASLTIEAVEAAVATFRPDVIYVDSGNLLGMEATGRLRDWERVAEVGKRIKSLAVTNNIPAVMTAHLVRNAGRDPNQPIDLSDIAGGEIYPRLTSVAVAITLPPDATADRQRTHTVIKNREGRETYYTVAHEFAGMSFCQINPETGEAVE
jgi:hypothetical protein